MKLTIGNQGKRKEKKRKKHEKPGLSKEDEEDLSEDEGDGRKGKAHSSHRRRSRETKSKHHTESENSEDSEEADEHGLTADDKPKVGDNSLIAGKKENGVEISGKRGKKQKIKERGRKKKRKSSPPNLKKHVSSRRRSPSTSDGSPTPGRGSNQRGNSVSKTQGSRGGTCEGGPSSIESNSSGGTKKHGDNTVDGRKPTESLGHRESGRFKNSVSQKKSLLIERDERRNHDGSRSSSSKSCSKASSASKSSGSANKDKGVKGGVPAKKVPNESVDKKRVAEPHSLNTSSSSSSPSSLSLSSISSSSSESSSSASSQSDSLTASSSSSSSSSSSASSLSSSESSSSLSSFVNLPRSPKVVSGAQKIAEPETLAKDNNCTPPLVSLKNTSKLEIQSPKLPESPQMPDISFSSLSKDSPKPQEAQNHFEDSLSKFCGIQVEKKYKIQVDDRKDRGLVDYSPQMGSKCAPLVSTDASGCASFDEWRPSEVLTYKDSESENLINQAESKVHGCASFVANEKVQYEQKDNGHMLSSTCQSNLGSRETKLQVKLEQVTFKMCSEDDPMNGKILGGEKGIGLSPSQPPRPSRWDTRPVVSTECKMLVSASPQEGMKESSNLATAVLPVPFPTCRGDKPLEEIPLPPLGGVPQPVASPWGPEGPLSSNVPIPILSSSKLPINPVCGLADSTISDSDLVRKCMSGGAGLLRAVPESSLIAKKVSLGKIHAVDNRSTTSSESERGVVEQFQVDSNHFLKTCVNRFQDIKEHSFGEKAVECGGGAAASVFSVDTTKLSFVKSTESAALSGGGECVVSPEADQAPIDWDDPEAFVGPGLTEIKSHVIQVGNFLQVVPSEQPMVPHSPFANQATPVLAVPPLAAAVVPPGGVVPVPVPPAANAFLSPVSPVKMPSVQPPPSTLSLAMPATQSVPNPPAVAGPVSPSSTLPPTPPPPSSMTLSSVAPLTTTSPSPLSHIPLLASLTPSSSSCPAISHLPLDPAAILGTLISHALALEKQQQQQQNRVHSPVCSPIVGVEEDEDMLKAEPPRAVLRAERQARRMEKRKKMTRATPSQPLTEKFPVEDAMSNTDPLTSAMTEDYCIDPEEVAFIQGAMSKVTGEEDEFAEQSSQVCRVKDKRKKPRVVMNTVLPPATRGILIPPGMREKPSLSSGRVSGQGLNLGAQGQRKSVMFADGVRPGDGTSPSAGEDLPSPPPPMRKMPKEKRLRKKKKIKVKIIRQIRMESTEVDDEDDDDDASPPPPPPGSPPPSLLLQPHLSASSPAATHHSEVPNPAAHYPYPSAPAIPPTHAFSQVLPSQTTAQQQQFPSLNPTSAPPLAASTAGGSSSALPPNALPRIPQWAPCT